MGKSKGGAAAETPSNAKALREELENLSCRFIVNLPANELASIERIGFQLPELSLRRFSEELLHVSSLVVPLIRLYMEKGPKSLERAYSQFMEYKTRVPVCGAIMLNKDWTKGWSKGASWTFPKGKINQHEPERDCALREVQEETGVDASHLLPVDSRDYLELTMREQKVRLYIIPGLPEDTPMETQTRREISRIEWFLLSELPTAKKAAKPSAELGGKFFLISPFVTRLRQWIQANKRTHPHKPPPQPKAAPPPKAQEQGESVSLDALFGAPRPQQVPGLISLPPSAQKQIHASQPTQSPGPSMEKSQASSQDSSKLLLNLLHGSKPVPAPPSAAGQNRVDGSDALRNLFGLGSHNVTTTLQPPAAQNNVSQQEHQAQLYAILGMPRGQPQQQQQQQAPQQPQPPLQPPPPPAHAPWGMPPQPVSQPDRSAEASQGDEQRNRLLSLLGGSKPSAPQPQAAPQPPQPSFHAPSSMAMPPMPHMPIAPHQPPHAPSAHFQRPAVHYAEPAPPAPGHAAWPSAPGPLSPPAQHAPQSHQHALLSTLLGSPSNAPPPRPAQSSPWPQPATPQHTSSSPWPGHAMPPRAEAPPTPQHPALSPQLSGAPPGGNSANLLTILNGSGGQPANDAPTSPPSSAPRPDAQAASNSLLATLLGK